MMCKVCYWKFIFVFLGKWERSKYVGVFFVGKILVIMGFGKVGIEVVRWVKGFGMNVIFYDFYVLVDRVRVFGVEFVFFD